MQLNMPKRSFAKTFFGDKAFYKMVLAIAVPIMVQNAISNFVNMLDNIMVGQLGTEPMSGVSIVNTLMFIYFLAIFGGVGGAGIFTAQYYGNHDMEGIRHTFRYKFWLALLITVIALVVLKGFNVPLISLYLTDTGEGGDLQLTLESAVQYLDIILLSLPAFMILQVYASNVRECGETVLPMKAGIVAVLVNLVFNYLLIYGKFGFPEMGVRGAAVATVLSRYVEAAIVMIWTHTHKERNPYIVGIYRTLKVPMHLVSLYFRKGIFLLFNEALWSTGMAVLTQCYSVRGLQVIAAMNIANTITNMFTIFFFAMGDAVAIIIGQKLGAGLLEEAKDADNKLIMFAILLACGTGILMGALSPFFVRFYNVEPGVAALAVSLMLVSACFKPNDAFLHTTYFTMRSGGKTFITFLFDSAYVWIVSAPVAYCLVHFTNLDIIRVYILVYSCDFIKSIIGFIMVKKNVWIVNMVSGDESH